MNPAYMRTQSIYVGAVGGSGVMPDVCDGEKHVTCLNQHEEVEVLLLHTSRVGIGNRNDFDNRPSMTGTVPAALL